MKRLLSLIVLVLLLMSTSALAGGYLDYGSYQSDMMDAFAHGKWQVVINLYEEICENWPNATDRKGDVDRYAIYASGRLAMDERNYNKAIADFDSLISPFPSGEDVLNSVNLKLYCQAQRFLLKGLKNEALATFRMCENVLDSAAMIRFLSETRQETLFAFAGKAESSSRVRLSWVDMDDTTQSYSVTYMPKGRETASKTAMASQADLVLEDLIPLTTYTVYLTPLKNGQVSGLSVQAEFTTPSGQRPTTIRIQEPKLYAYSTAIRDQHNYRITSSSEDRFLSAFSYSKQVEYFLEMGYVQEASTIEVPFGSLEGSYNTKGYIFQCVLARSDSLSQPEGMIRVVLRSIHGDNPNQVYWTDVPFTFEKEKNKDKLEKFTALTFYLDPLLDQVYGEQGWPDDTDLIFELYYGEELLLQTTYHLLIS